MTTYTDQANAAAANFGGGGVVDQPDIIGDYSAVDTTTTASSPQNVTRDSIRGGAEVYREGDDFAIWETLPTEYRYRLQDALVSLGFSKGVTPGDYDQQTEKGFNTLLMLSNRSATKWDEKISSLMQLKAEGLLGDGGGGGGPRLPAFKAPDPATLAQTVKQSLRRQLGRDPQQDELDSLSAELSTYARQAYDAQIAAAQGASTTDVDPQARFAELVESKYANELQMIDDREDQALVTATSKQQMGFVDRVLGAM